MWPIDFHDVLRARKRIEPFLPATAMRHYGALDDEVGAGIEVWVKHENHQPTNSFKIRNGMSVMSAMPKDARERGVVAATRGNHGLGLCQAAATFGAPAVICVPVGNNPEKNLAMRALGAELIEDGRDYDESVEIANRLVDERGLTLVHSTNNREVIAGAGTMTLEILGQQPDLDALVLSVGGGSQVVGALTVARTMSPGLEVFGVQAARASATHDSWHAGEPRTTDSAATVADGLATRSSYAMTFPAMREGLADFLVVEEDEIAEAMRCYMRTTHNIVEGAAAAGLAGLMHLRERLAGKRVGLVISGGNLDAETLRWAFGEGPWPLGSTI